MFAAWTSNAGEVIDVRTPRVLGFVMNNPLSNKQTGDVAVRDNLRYHVDARGLYIMSDADVPGELALKLI